MNDLNLDVNGFGLINKAHIKINKINVVGGINSSGKSTVSRFLYCFLKANTLNSDEYIKKIFIKEINNLINPNNELFSIDDKLSDILKKYEDFKKNNKKNSQIESIDFLIKLSSENKNYFTSYILEELINKENIGYFTKGSSKLSCSSFKSLIANDKVNAQFDEAGFVESYGEEYDLSSDLYVIKSEGFLDCPEIFYIDSFSILDMLHYVHYEKLGDDNQEMDIINPKNHVNYLIENIYDQTYFHSIDDCDEKIVEVLNKIDKIIHGYVGSHPLSLDFTFAHSPSKVDDDYGSEENPVSLFGTGNTSSGIKQIGIIQLLLSKEKLKQGSFLMIDEPEVNLHPKWQFKFAEILVILAKELDITIYLNSHSPTFIESIDAFCEFYDMEDDVNYYLTQESEIEGKYDFINVNSNELYKIYDNLGDVFKLIDDLRIKKRLNE